MLIEREVVKRMQDVDLHPSLTGGWERSLGPRTLCSEPLPSRVPTPAEPMCFPQVLPRMRVCCAVYPKGSAGVSARERAQALGTMKSICAVI